LKTTKFPSFNIAKHTILLWILAFFITVALAAFQRMTGPTYPYRGKLTLDNHKISFKLLRSETTGEDLKIALDVPDRNISGTVKFRRLNSQDQWEEFRMNRENDQLIAHLPSQPPAGKIAYFVYVHQNGKAVSLSGEKPIVARYKGSVPEGILIPHILLMFLGLLFSNRAAFEAFDHRGNAYKYILWTIGFFLVGGFILGPLVQKYAFGELWTGIPFGYDLTDNKTLIAMLGWIWAWFKNRKGREARGWIIFAAILMVAVYLIPHSVLGSELDYTKMK